MKVSLPLRNDLLKRVHLSSRSTLLISLWLFVFAGFYLYRSSVPALFWNDSIELSLFKSVPSGQTLTFEGARTTYNLGEIFNQAFGGLTADGYRPLSEFYRLLASESLSNDPASQTGIVLIAGAFLACLTVCVLLVARRFVRSDTAAGIVIILLMCSAPVVTGAWIVFAGVQSLVPLIICAGLLLYWQLLTATAQRKPYYFIALCATMFIGPWFREFTGILPVLIILQEIAHTRRVTRLTGVGAIFLLHALFPTALVKLLFFPSLPLRPVFAMGLLGSRVGSVPTNASFVRELQDFLTGLKWDAIPQFIVLFPLTLWVVVITGVLVLSLAGIMSVGQQKKLLRDAVQEEVSRYWLLSTWFLLSFLPFLKVYTEPVHLAYSLLPASILVAAMIERIGLRIAQLEYPFRGARYGFGALIVLVLLDQSLTLYGTYTVNQQTSEGEYEVAYWLTQNTPKGAIIISNAIHLAEIHYYSNYHFVPVWTVSAGLYGGATSVMSSDILERLLQKNNNKVPVYFLDVDFNYDRGKVNYHSHRFVRNHSVDMQDLGIIHITRARYPFVDPLKEFVPRSYVTWLGAPDLENDFYHGGAQDGSLFMREAYANYHLYLVTGTKVELLPSRIPQ